jgi:hypothetical protein
MTRDNDKTHSPTKYNSGTKVVWGKTVARRLAVVPGNVAAKFLEWVDAVKKVLLL